MGGVQSGVQQDLGVVLVFDEACDALHTLRLGQRRRLIGAAEVAIIDGVAVEVVAVEVEVGVEIEQRLSGAERCRGADRAAHGVAGVGALENADDVIHVAIQFVRLGVAFDVRGEGVGEGGGLDVRP